MTTDEVGAGTVPVPRPRALRLPRGWPGSTVRHAVVIGLIVITIYPLIWLVVASLRPQDANFFDPGLSVNGMTLENYQLGWDALTHPFGRYLINSGILVLGAIIGNLVSCSMAAYAFARIRFRGRSVWFAIMLMSIMVPFHVVVVPQYIVFSKLGWVNTFLPLIVPKFLAVDSFFIFLMVQFLRTLPRELDEAAGIDGAGHLRIFGQVLLPLMVPALAATAIFTFIWTWNDFFTQLIYLTTPESMTVSVALRGFLDASSFSLWGQMFAMSVVTLVPVFFVFLIGQRYLLRGFATTGFK
jgi:multiple sugar transport system permease protein